MKKFVLGFFSGVVVAVSACAIALHVFDECDCCDDCDCDRCCQDDFME